MVAATIFFLLFLLYIPILWLLDCCRDQRWTLPRSNPRASIYPATHQSWFVNRWLHQNNVRNDLPVVTHQPPCTSAMPRGPHQSNARTGIPPATHQLQFAATVLSEAHQNNVRIDIPVPFEESQFVSHMPRDFSIMTPLPIPPDMMPSIHSMPPMPFMPSMPPMPPMPPMPSMPPMPFMPSMPLMPPMPPMPCEPPRNPSVSTITLASSLETDKGGECTVCLDNLQGQDAVVQMPLCSHLFHKKCIRQWLLWQPSCPLCRSPLHA